MINIRQSIESQPTCARHAMNTTSSNGQNLLASTRMGVDRRPPNARHMPTTAQRGQRMVKRRAIADGQSTRLNGSCTVSTTDQLSPHIRTTTTSPCVRRTAGRMSSTMLPTLNPCSIKVDGRHMAAPVSNRATILTIPQPTRERQCDTTTSICACIVATLSIRGRPHPS
jgi:hypothetical protein